MVDTSRDSFPRRQARTQRFSLGRPRDMRVASDGSRVTFLRSAAGDDPANCLWVLDVASFQERLVLDPRDLGPLAAAEESPEEKARRERARERAGGVVSYAADSLLRTATVVLGGKLYVVDLISGGARGVDTPAPVFDPRPDDSGARIAYVCGGAVRVVDGGGDRALLPASGEGTREGVTWGLAEHIAAEEMGRSRGHWWSPDGTRVAMTRVDESQVALWYLADPGEPEAPPTPQRYPVAGGANADAALFVVGLDGEGIEVQWDRTTFPYLADVGWQLGAPLTLAVQSRDQRTLQVLTVDESSAETQVRDEATDDAWVDLVPGVPTWAAAGQLVTTAYLDDTRRVLVDGRPVSPSNCEVRAVVHVDQEILFTASVDPTEVHVWRATPDGRARQVTTEAGVHTAVAGGDVVVVSSSFLDGDTIVAVWRKDGFVGEIRSNAESPSVRPEPRFLSVGDRDLRTAVLLPGATSPGTKLPVIVSPYGGPGHQRVLKDRRLFLESQWLADQGFAVVVADGRGTGGRGRLWDRELRGDLAGPVLADQVEALTAAATLVPEIDLTRVAIWGWSFGGFLAALAVLRRPNIFHVAVAGAPVTDWRLYDTHYTERFLGLPDDDPEAYERSSLFADAPGLSRPLLLVHGLDDDNVVAAHTFRLSRELSRAGRPHSVVPLSGVTHLASREEEAENLLRLELEFIRTALRLGEPG